MFIIQACRGGKRDPGLKGDPTDSAAPPPPNVDNSIEIDISVSSMCTISVLNYFILLQVRGENTDPTDGGENTIPVEGDIVIAYCTVSGTVVWVILARCKFFRILLPS